MSDFDNTPHYKGSKRQGSPPKADHEHEYIRPYAMLHKRRFDGTLTAETFKTSLIQYCTICDHAPRRNNREAVEVEVDPKEFWRLKDEIDDLAREARR